MEVSFRSKFNKDIEDIIEKSVLEAIYRIGIYVIDNVVEFARVLPRDKIYKYFPF